MAKLAEGDLILDMRTVFPRQDMHVVDTFLGLTEKPTPAVDESQSPEI
jgi:hypothetical protein